MILKDALRAIGRRARNPLHMGLAFGFFGVNIGLLWLSYWTQSQIQGGPGHPVLHPIHPDLFLTLSTLVGCLYLFLCTPFPWQWSGDGRLMSPVMRGVMLALACHIPYVIAGGLLHWRLLAETLVPFQRWRGIFLGLMALGCLFSICYQTLIGFALALMEARKTEKAEAEHQAEEARWTLLKAQMSPHVLLNSLNGLAELVREDADLAAKGMRDLAEIYRQLLELGDAPQLPLGQERELLERYLAVEQLRLGAHLRVEWDWEPALDVVKAMPLLLQPLVENAIKHGVAADPAGGVIRITARRDSERLKLVVANTGGAPAGVFRPRSGTGVGLRNLKARLEMAYRGRASFDLVKESPWMRAELSLPVEEAR